MSRKVYLLVGFLGSGKSTWAKKKVKADKNVLIVNRDSLRTMLLGEYGFSVPVELAVKDCAKVIFDALLQAGFDVIIDETNLTLHKRRTWLRYIEQYCIRNNQKIDIQVVHFTESENNVAYRAQDDLRGVSVAKWAEVLDKMKREYESPEISEFPEGTVYSVMMMDEERVEATND